MVYNSCRVSSKGSHLLHIELFCRRERLVLASLVLVVLLILPEIKKIDMLCFLVLFQEVNYGLIFMVYTSIFPVRLGSSVCLPIFKTKTSLSACNTFSAFTPFGASLGVTLQTVHMVSCSSFLLYINSELYGVLFVRASQISSGICNQIADVIWKYSCLGN